LEIASALGVTFCVAPGPKLRLMWNGERAEI
jgi:hypothetical protein